MRIIRAIFAGIFIGAVLFFVPFLFPFILFLFLISFIARFFFYRRWSRWGHYRNYEHPYSYGGWDEGEDIVPIDRKWYSSPMHRGPEQQYPVR